MLTNRIKAFLVVNCRRIMKGFVHWIHKNKELSFIATILIGSIFARLIGFELVFCFFLGIITTLIMLAIFERYK